MSFGLVINVEHRTGGNNYKNPASYRTAMRWFPLGWILLVFSFKIVCQQPLSLRDPGLRGGDPKQIFQNVHMHPETRK